MKKKSPPKIAEAPEQVVALSKINPAAYNPRIDLGPEDRTMLEIKKSLEVFGVVIPLVWNKRTGNLVSGHQRLKVLSEAGVKTTRVRVVDLPLERERVLNVAINRIAGGWDREKMEKTLAAIDKVDGDLALAGFTEEEKALFDAPIDEPPAFRTVGADLKTDHRCPKCAYEWSGECVGEPEAPAGK